MGPTGGATGVVGEVVTTEAAAVNAWNPGTKGRRAAENCPPD